MTPRLIMLDSGAFTVWSKGETIDLDKYIEFCLSRPATSYFVSLDVIPGKPRDVKSRNNVAIEQSCQLGWDNYQKMLKYLPIEKVIPVYHQSDSLKWLERYLSFGTPYLGISPSNDRSTAQKMEWMRSLRGTLCDENGDPKIKTHGFAVTSYDLMKAWHWHSVDSASWMSVASFGGIYMPQTTGGSWDFTKSPRIIAMSAKSPSKADFQAHYTTLTPVVKEQLKEWCRQCGVALGKYEVIKVEAGYKRDTKTELWYDEKKNAIVRILSRGCSTDHNVRRLVNIKFIEEANKVLPVDNIYFAGNTGNGDYVEKACNRRLISYYWTILDKKACKIFDKHYHAVQVANEGQSRTVHQEALGGVSGAG